MAPFDPNEMVGTLMGGVAKFGESVEIIRSPIEVGNKVIIPAVVARLGVGAGGGSGKRGHGSNEEGSGGGGGGGMTLTPVFLVVDAQGERMITIPNSLASASDILDTVKVAAGKIFGKKKGESTSSE
jgi:uncharacterized spore protein YtfJ